MKPFDRDNQTAKTVPEMIQKLWALYRDMSTDPALAASACHIRSAALALEDMRRMAFEVYLEGQQDALGKPAKKARRNLRDRDQTSISATSRDTARTAAKDEATLKWLMTARAASPWKN